MLRKITAIVMLKKIYMQLESNLPMNQTAYRKRRSTTELVFAIKILSEKAISSSEYVTNNLLLDTSKAFDFIYRNMLLNDLKDILQPDEVHMLSILIMDVNLAIKSDHTLGKDFITTKGIPQGNCLSPIIILFTIYLAKALKQNVINEIEEDNDHNYAKVYRTADILINDEISHHLHSMYNRIWITQYAWINNIQMILVGYQTLNPK